MSLASPIVLAPKNSTPASVWTTQKNHGLPPKAPWLQQKPVAETAGELPPLPLPNAQLVVPHSIPVLVSGPATDTTVPDSENAAPKETDDALCARLAAQPNDQLNSREQELRATVLEIEAFIGEEAPTQSQLVAACNALKAMAGDNNHKLKSLPDTCSGDWVRFLSISIEKFLKHLSSLETNQFPWDEMTMRQFAQMCYGLKACYDLNRNADFFLRKQFQSLLQAGRQITRKLIDQVHQRSLIPSHQNCGDVLSLLAWITAGLQCRFSIPGGGHRTLLAGCSTEPGKVSLADIGTDIFAYFEDAQSAYMTPRQIGKLINGIGRLLTDGVLPLGGSEPNANKLSQQRLQRALLSWCIRLPISATALAHNDPPNSNSEVTVVVVRNVITGIDHLMRKNILEMIEKDSQTIIRRGQQLIAWALSQPDLDVHMLKDFRGFLQRGMNVDLFNQSIAGQLAQVENLIAARQAQS